AFVDLPRRVELRLDALPVPDCLRADFAPPRDDWPRALLFDCLPRDVEREEELEVPREDARDRELVFFPDVLREEVLAELALLRWVGMVFPLRGESNSEVECSRIARCTRVRI